MPQIFTLVMYEMLDQFRMYDAMHDQEISKSFYRFYTVCTVYECCAFISFIQTMATGPGIVITIHCSNLNSRDGSIMDMTFIRLLLSPSDEQWQIHSAPYLMMIYGLWTMAFKRFLYLWKSGKLERDRKGRACPQLKAYAGWYVSCL